MVRVDDNQHWQGPGNEGNNGLIVVDADGRRELRISPASAFKRPHVEKPSVSENVCPSAPLLTNLPFDPSKEQIHLHKCLRKADWNALCAALDELQKRDDVFDLQCALYKENEERETPLHTAAWKCPTDISLRMLELTPHNHRKELLLRRDEVGNTVLHLCCANLDERVEFTMVKNVLLLAPEALEMVNVFGDTPLHLLVCSPGFRKSNDFTVEIAAEEAVTSLLSLVKEQGTAQNQLGLTLLHCAIAHGSHERVLFQLLKVSPEAASVADVRGMLPLHFAAAFGNTPWTFVEKLIEVYPAALLAPTEEGDTPLHLLIANADKQLNAAGLLDRNTTKIAELLLSTPHSQKCALFMPNNEKLYPLHCCAIFDSPIQLTRILMGSEHAPAASVIPTHSGWTALHLACAATTGSKPTDNAEALATQRACRTFDAHDRTPIMLALESSTVSARLVKYLAKYCPKCTNLPTRRGKYLPIHLALERNVRESIIQRLVKSNPSSLMMENSNGDTALHIACRRGVAVSTIKFLLNKCRDARLKKNKHGEYPFDLAEWHGIATDIPDLYDEAIGKEKNMCNGSLSSAESLEFKRKVQVTFH